MSGVLWLHMKVRTSTASPKRGTDKSCAKLHNHYVQGLQATTDKEKFDSKRNMNLPTEIRGPPFKWALYPNVCNGVRRVSEKGLSRAGKPPDATATY